MESENNSQLLSARLEAALRLVDEAIVDASAALKDAPDNPAVKRSGSIGFSIKSTEVFGSGNWSVFYHDWLEQYRYARELLEARRFSALTELLGGHSYKDPSHGVRAFAPEVIERIKAITGDLREAIRLTDAGKMTAGTAGASTKARTARP